MAQSKKSNRKDLILQSLARMLETNAGSRITIANLAVDVGVSEATLYRHFSSKSKIYEGLIDFVEELFLSRINIIMNDEKDTIIRCQRVLQLILFFAERNPGISRLLHGDALMGEGEALRGRIKVLFAKVETLLKQILREKALREGKRFDLDESILSNFLLAFAEGKISQFVRSGFKLKPTHNFDEQWHVIECQLKLIN